MSFLDFKEIPTPKRRKTSIFQVQNKKGQVLGFVKWYPPWRRFCFESPTDCVFDAGCLREVAGFIDGLMDQRGAEQWARRDQDGGS